MGCRIRIISWIATVLAWLLLGSGCSNLPTGDRVPGAAEDEAGQVEDRVSSNPETDGCEFRGIWVTRWDYRTPEDIASIMHKIAESHFNAVMFQVRGRADAFYPSSYEPWAEELTGRLGQDPGWDPLETALEQAHACGLEFHAWINVFTCWNKDTEPSESTPRHILLDHPDWVQINQGGTRTDPNSGYVFVSPGNPAAQSHIRNVLREIVEKYALDGVHLDYIRYAGKAYSYDETSLKRFTADNPEGLSREDWQRRQIDEFLSASYRELISIRPSLKISAAVWGIYRDSWGWSRSGGFDAYYQDSSGWIRAGIIDAICPMIYWANEKTTPPYFNELAEDFLKPGRIRHVYPGISAELHDFSQIEAQISVSRELGAKGMVLFSYGLLNSKNLWELFSSGPFRDATRPPDMPWKQERRL